MTQQESVALTRVRRRVAALGFFAVAIHGVLGLVGVAHVLVGQDRHSDAVVLVVMSGVFAAITYVVVRIILDAPLRSPAWIVVAMLPTATAAIWIV